MKRIVPGAAFAAALMMSASAFAADTTTLPDTSDSTPSATMAPTQPAETTPAAVSSTSPAVHRTSLATKYSNECTSLEGQWSTASSEHANAHNFHKAEHQAKLGAMSCESHKAATLRTGVTHYRSALKLIGVKPTV